MRLSSLQTVQRLAKLPLPNGVVLYRGPSKIDGKPIVVVAIFESSNDKTSNMIQTYIMPDQGLKPSDATKENQDISVCGGCKYKGDAGKDRQCYVNLGQGPRAVYEKLESDNPYPKFDAKIHLPRFKGRKLRFGTWGDPAAVPARIWGMIVGVVDGWTGYTHQKLSTNRHLRQILMASCDSVADVQAAWDQDWRTFRVKQPSEPLLPGEISCPASEEAGKVTDCEHCGLCAGASVGPSVVKGIAINAHGGFGVMAVWNKAKSVELTIGKTR